MRFKWNCNQIWLMEQLLTFQNYENKPLQQKNGRSSYWKHRWALYIQNKQGRHILLISLEIRLFFHSIFGELDMFDPLLLRKRLLYSALEKKIGREKPLYIDRLKCDAAVEIDKSIKFLTYFKQTLSLFFLFNTFYKNR